MAEPFRIHHRGSDLKRFFPSLLASHHTLLSLIWTVGFVLIFIWQRTAVDRLLEFRRWALQSTPIPQLRPLVLELTDFGAVGNGLRVNTEAFERAIAEIKMNGGGQLNVRPGYWLTAPFNLTSHMTLFLAENAVILGSDDEKYWPLMSPLPSYGYGREHSGPRYGSLIHGQNLKDVVITDSCQDMLIEYCYISVGDDGIAIKSGWDQYGIAYDKPSTNILIRNVIVRSTVRSLLCRPLPVDVGRCTCVIVKEASAEGIHGGTIYTLYTNEGQGRQNRKLAVAHHKLHNGRSEFVVAQNTKGISSSSDDSFVGTVTANLMGSKYYIWDQGRRLNSVTKHSKLLAAVTFMPTLATWTGSYRSMRAWIPKHQSMQLKNTSQTQHINGLPKDWEEKMDKVHQLFSKVPHYNTISKQYELDFRDRGRSGLRIQSSVKNFQLILEVNKVTYAVFEGTQD